MKALANWSGALAGLLLILIGGLLPSALLIPSMPLQLMDLPATWQVPGYRPQEGLRGRPVPANNPRRRPPILSNRNL